MNRPLDGFLLELSSALVAVQPSAVDSAIPHWLRELVSVLDVDRACVSVISADESGTTVQHYSAVDDTPAPAGPERSSRCDWLAEWVRESHPLRAQRLSSSEAADVAGAFGTRGGPRLKSCLMLPFAVDGAPPGALAIGCIRRHRSWSDDLVASLTFVANAFASAIARSRAHEALEERVVFERLLTDFVTTLVSVPADLVVERLEHGLTRLMEHFGLDRAGLGRFTADGSLVRVCGVSAPGIPSMEAKLELPWFVDELRQGRSVRVNEVSTGLPTGATAERDYVAQAGIRSQLTIPLVAGDRVWGGIGFAAVSRARTWTDEHAQRLGLVGEIMMQAYLRAQSEREEQQQRDELAHVARVAALGELAAALAHELNQPLMAIRVNAQATRRVLRAGQATDLHEVLDDIAADATRAGDLIARLRDLLRRREPRKELLDVNDVIAAVHTIAQTEAHRHAAELYVEATPALPPVLGDPVQLQQVVLNLVRNAAEAMSAQVGSRTVRIRTSATADDHVNISVEDEGSPIDDATLGAMFTPFSSTKTGGLGLGLAISRSIVEAHAGRLWAERRAKGGLAVSLTLPAQTKG